MTTIIDASRDDYALMGEIVAEGFADDPVNLWAFNGTGAMPTVYTNMARSLYLRHGFGHRSEGGEAGTLWLPPGARKSLGLRASLNIAGALIRHAGLSGIRNSLAVNELMAEKHPTEAHYYLFAIAARPRYQGTGLGGALMRKGLDIVDAAGMPAYLENSKERNISFYRHFGFDIVEQIQPAGGPPLWLMWREPR